MDHIGSQVAPAFIAWTVASLSSASWLKLVARELPQWLQSGKGTSVKSNTFAGEISWCTIP
jgi:hypothetical protein